jgi:hypothetical protein
MLVSSVEFVDSDLAGFLDFLLTHGRFYFFSASSVLLCQGQRYGVCAYQTLTNNDDGCLIFQRLH